MKGRRRGPHDRRRAQESGRFAEVIAALWLTTKGYRVLARNYLGGGGEIDIIARRGSTLVFVEVKARPSLDEALIAVDRAKLEQIARAGRAYLAEQQIAAGVAIRFDVVLVAPGQLPRHMRNVAELPPLG